MHEKTIRTVKLIIFTLLVAGLLTGPAQMVTTAGAATSQLPYGWTIEKMKNAIPYPMKEMAIPFKGAQRAAPQAVGTPGWVPSRPPDGWTRPLITNNPAGTYPPPAPTLNNVTDYVPLDDILKFPHIATGKIYFVQNGRNYVCSGSVIGENTVWTAGHCVSNGAGVFHDKWLFVPDFDMYSSRFDGYVSVYAATPSEFALNTDLSHDYAIVGVRSESLNGKSIRQEVGAVGFAWNMPRQQQWLLLGYPQLIFDGVRQVFSNGTYYEDNPGFTPPSIGVGSRMKDGCSGGPWLLNPMIGEAGEANYLNGTSSYISSVVEELFSPYLDDRAKRLWDCAQNSTPDRLVCADSKAAANLVLTNIAGSGPVPAGSQFTYTLKLENFGPADATNIVLTDRLPVEVSVVSFDLPGGACSLSSPNPVINVVTCTLGTLPSGASAIATVKVNALPARGAFSNMASVSFDQVGEWTSAAGAYTLVCNGDHITVTNTNDSGPGSLREAIDTLCAGGTIDFDPALSGAVIHLVSQLEPTGSMIIDGSALSQRLTLSGDTDGDGVGDTRVLDVKNSVTLDSLIITKGHSADRAGGIFNEGGLTLKNCTLTDNSSDYAGGGIFNKIAQNLTVINSTLSGNSAPYGGGIYIESGETICRVCSPGIVTLTNSALSGNTATTEAADGGGGGIYNKGTLTIMDSTLSGNSAPFGGGIDNYSALTITNSTLSANSATDGDGGGIFNNTDSALTITNSMLSGNSTADADGGGIANLGVLTLTNSTLSGNSTGGGGSGIYNSGALTITGSTLSGNSAANADGGGIYNDTDSALTITNSTLSGNSTGGGGGGIANSGVLTLTNSTLSGNSTGSSGGGIANSGVLTLTNSTLSGNSAPNGYGGGVYNSGTFAYANTIIANTVSSEDCFNDGGTIGINTNNLVEDGTCPDGGVNLSTGDPKLGPLADNGGPTLTMALLAGSLAVDAGDDAICAAQPVNNTSQNGDSRPRGGHCDIGAYEFQSVTATAIIPAATGNGSITLSVTTPGCGFTSYGTRTEDEMGGDSLYDYPYGLVEFTLNCAEADVRITFPGDVTGTIYRKYGPTTPGNPATATWYTLTSAAVNRNTVTLHLIDGQLGDDTGPEGRIVDQGGPGVSATVVPTMTEWGMLSFMLLAGAAAVYHLRRKSIRS